MNREEILERLKKGEDPLELAIRKWQDIANGEKQTGNHESNCALCETHDECEDCPISLFTGDTACDNTPYVLYCNTHGEESRIFYAKLEVQFLKHIQKMLNKKEAVV